MLAVMYPRIEAVLVVVTMMAACAPAPREAAAPAVLVERARVSMGSELRLTAWTSDEANAAAAFEHVFEDFEYLDRMLSVWHPDSDVSRLNASAGQGAIRMNPITIEILQIARGVSEQTGGKFDVTFGALSGLWKFDHDQDERVPRRDEVIARLPLVDFRQLEIDIPAGTARLRQPGMRVHLGGIGKGYAVDRAATILRSHGITDFMIQAGGDLYVGVLG